MVNQPCLGVNKNLNKIRIVVRFLNHCLARTKEAGRKKGVAAFGTLVEFR
jgi:hypothetical protein